MLRCYLQNISKSSVYWLHLGIVEERWVRNLHGSSRMVVTHELDGDQSESLSVELSHLAQCDLVTAVNDPVLG